MALIGANIAVCSLFIQIVFDDVVIIFHKVTNYLNAILFSGWDHNKEQLFHIAQKES